MYLSKQSTDRPDRSDGQQCRPTQKPSVSTMTIQADEPQPMHRLRQPQVTNGSARSACPCCGQNGYLDQCSTFFNMEMSTHHRYMKSSALCELCLKQETPLIDAAHLSFAAWIVAKLLIIPFCMR
ncbi:hypothetical protein FGIG_06884 [Fasciola gigantica]|uniref:Uncharacterized protein n=1 Tax=Fasciola gigantica TaxID=46835 RepID=A0A504YEU3_FASGI|nr:hypothetical protein FGIG_06884 [Fasciola gigantica]